MIYGTKFHQVKEEAFKGKCPNCGTANTVTVRILQEYIHVMWIPAIPYEKMAVSECSNCRQTLSFKSMPTNLRAFSNNLKSSSKTPLWVFSGVALILLVIAAALIVNQVNSKRNAKLVLKPQVNDIYEIKTEDKNYTLYKIVRVISDSIYIVPNQYQVSLQSGLSELKEKSYLSDTFYFTKNVLKKMFDNGEIVNINRK